MATTIIPDSTGGYVVWRPYDDEMNYSDKAFVMKIIAWHDYEPADEEVVGSHWMEPITVHIDGGDSAKSLAHDGEWYWFPTEQAAEDYAATVKTKMESQKSS